MKLNKLERIGGSKMNLADISTDFEVIRYVRNKLKEQGKKSVAHTVYADQCLYRNPEHLSCAVGQLIDNNNYHSDLEGKMACSREIINAVSKSMPEWIVNPMLLEDMREIHDEYEPEDWYEHYTEMLNYVNSNGIYKG